MSGAKTDELNQLIGQIYDCAVDPTHWAQTLTRIRDRMDMACVHLTFVDGRYVRPGDDAELISFRSSWPEEWTSWLHRWMSDIPGVEKLFAAGIDESVSQMQAISEDDLRRTSFYREWLKPQGLRDYSCTVVAKREKMVGTLVAATRSSGDLIDDRHQALFEALSPHLRRSLLISGMLDDGRMQLQLYRDILDRVAAGVVIVARDARLVYANPLAEAMIEKGASLTVRRGKLQAVSPPHARGLAEALERACSEDAGDLGTRGNGIPLPARDGSTGVCYVLPLGRSDRRRSLGPGLAALFVASGDSNLPPSLEVLSALTGLTSQEARVALMIADGMTPAETAEALAVSITTVRTHLARIFDKTGTGSQRALARFVAGLSLPITPPPASSPLSARPAGAAAHSLG